MYKIDIIKGLFDCDICKNLLVDPISLPCGNNVCKHHLEYFGKKKIVLGKSFVCEVCKDKHYVPEKGHFIVNKQIKKALDIELNNLKVSSSAHNECKDIIKEAKESLAQIETLEKNAEGYICEHFANIKRQVEIRNEMLKAEIDGYSCGLIRSIERAKDEFIKLSKVLEFDIEDLGVLKKDLTQTVHSYNDHLFENKNYDFIFEQQPISSIFGGLFEV